MLLKAALGQCFLGSGMPLWCFLADQALAVAAAVAPATLQAEVVSLVPRLVAPAEHTQAAGALLGRLAEASRQGPGCEAGLRMPVLAALGRLRIDPAVADRVLHAALAVRTFHQHTRPLMPVALHLQSSAVPAERLAEISS